MGKTARHLVAAALENLAAVGKPVTAAAFSHVHLRRYAAYSYGYYPGAYGDPAGPDLDGESDLGSRARVFCGSASENRCFERLGSDVGTNGGAAALALIVVLFLFGYSLYANMEHLPSGGIDAGRADTIEDRSQDVARLREQPPAATDRTAGGHCLLAGAGSG